MELSYRFHANSEVEREVGLYDTKILTKIAIQNSFTDRTENFRLKNAG